MLKNFKKKLSLHVKKFRAATEYNPHKTFQLTRRRDYVRPLELPHPIAFIIEVNQTLWNYRRIFFPLAVVYMVLYGLLVGLGSQEIYAQLNESLKEAGGDVLTGTFGPLAQSSLTLLALVTNGIDTQLSDAQRIFGVLLTLMAWLTIVWLLRNILAGNTVRMRDGLYSAGAPLMATAVVALVIALQLLPLALAAVGYSAAVSSGLIAAGGVAAMLFWIAAGLLAILSLYWVSSSIFAMVIITLPGMYPVQALRSSYRLLLGRRVRFLLRFVWMAAFVAAPWVIICIPVILFDGWIKSVWPTIAWLPIIPVLLLLIGTYTVFWTSVYIYLLYRKVVDANEPA
jgi:hypothetical protein